MRPSEQNTWLPWDLQRKVPEGPALGWRAEKLPWGGDIRREGRAPVSLVCTNTWISISPRQWQTVTVAWNESHPLIAFSDAPLGSMSAVVWGFWGVLASSLCILGLEDSRRVQWCAVGQQERAKCDHWSAVSGGALACVTEETPEDCIAAITVGSPTSSSGPWFGFRFCWVCSFQSLSVVKITTWVTLE